jgi:hypothetical protein
VAKRFSHTVPRVPIEFEMGGEDFTAPPLLDPDVLGEVLEQHAKLRGINVEGAEEDPLDALRQIKTVIAEIFDSVLVPESAERVRARLLGRSNPFDLNREVIPTLTSLVEEYTGRPTKPSSSSSNGSNDGGTSSTDGQPAEASTPLPSPPTDS